MSAKRQVRCSVCRHAETADIDLALALDRESLRTLASRWSLDKSALWRHRNGHLAGDLLAAFVDDDPTADLTASRLLIDLRATLDALAVERDAARVEGQREEFRRLADSHRQSVESLGRLLGLVVHRVEVAPGEPFGPQWERLRSRLLEVLDDHPAARQAVLEALGGEMVA